ncbi:MAG: hypothetical protein QNJ55_27185 [Xenococcus sp. MO_188.B8]|nr:hypothetical protein [Xenococcus sp. MO_188.B8]
MKTNSCIDFRPDPNAKIEEQWCPEGYSYYDGHLVRDRSRYTPEEQLKILDTHPFFTGVCPVCQHQFDENNPPAVHWDCPVICSKISKTYINFKPQCYLCFLRCTLRLFVNDFL